MLTEMDRRREEFLGGIPLMLADEQYWAFPGPRETSPEGQAQDPGLVALLGVIATSESEADRRRAELALAIRLLGRNYQLTPAEYQELLGSSGSEATRKRLMASFQDLARRHGEALQPRPATSESGPTPSRRFRFPFFRSQTKATPHARSAPRRAAS